MESVSVSQWSIKETSLTTTYRKKWSLWEAIREICQNSLDETSKLPALKVEGNKLILSDEGKGMTLPQFFLLGVSEKTNADARGQFGLGAKDACVVLSRLGKTVTVRSQSWIAQPIVGSFRGYETLNFRYMEDLPSVVGVTYTIEGLTVDETSDIQKLLKERFVSKESKGYTSVYCGQVLTSSEYKGKIFVKDIYVSETPKPSIFGWNFQNGVTLDSDRNIASPFDVQYRVGQLLETIDDINDCKKIIGQFKKDSFEAQACYVRLNDNFRWAFKELYGDTTTVSSDESLRGKINHRGRNLVIFQNKSFIDALAKEGIEMGEAFLEAYSKMINEQKKLAFSELTNSQRATFTKALKLVNEILETNQKVEDVMFIKSSTMLGVYNGGILLSTIALKDLALAIESLGHEVLHKITGYSDATAQFQSALDDFVTKTLRYFIGKGLQFEAKILGNTITIPQPILEKLGKGYVKLTAKKIWE